MALFRDRIRRRQERRRGRGGRGAVRLAMLFVVGLSLLFLGIYFLVERFWSGVPGLDVLWPVFPLIAGSGFLLGYLASGLRRSSLVLPGVLALGVGGFFLLFTLGPLRYEQMESLWPVFPLLLGIALFWTWVASFGRRVRLLVPAVLFTVVGVVGLAFTVTVVGPTLSVFGWPLLLLGGGVLFMLLAAIAVGVRLLGASGT